MCDLLSFLKSPFKALQIIFFFFVYVFSLTKGYYHIVNSLVLTQFADYNFCDINE